MLRRSLGHLKRIQDEESGLTLKTSEKSVPVEQLGQDSGLEMHSKKPIYSCKELPLLTSLS